MTRYETRVESLKLGVEDVRHFDDVRALLVVVAAVAEDYPAHKTEQNSMIRPSKTNKTTIIIAAKSQKEPCRRASFGRERGAATRPDSGEGHKPTPSLFIRANALPLAGAMRVAPRLRS